MTVSKKSQDNKKDEEVHLRDDETLNIRNLEFKNSIFDQESYGTRQNDFDAISFDLGKSPNFVFIENLNREEQIRENLKNICYKVTECVFDTNMYFVNYFLDNKSCFLIFLLFNLIFHYFSN